MARLALVVLAFGLFICVYAESDEVQEYRYQDNSRYNRNKGRYDYNRDSGKNQKKWEDRPSRHDYHNKGRYSYDRYNKNRNNDPDCRHSGNRNHHGKYDTDHYHSNEDKDWLSRYDSDHNRGDFHSNKGTKGGWNNDRDFRGRNRGDYKRKNWHNQDKWYGSGEDKGRGNDYRFDYNGGNDNDKHNNGGRNEKDSGERRFDTPSRGASPHYSYERSNSEEHNYENKNNQNSDNKSTSNVGPTINDHNNRNYQSNRGRGNSYEGDRRFEDNSKEKEDANDNNERSSSEEHYYGTNRDSRNKPNTDSESNINFGPITNDNYNQRNSQSNRGKGNSYRIDWRFEDNSKERQDAISRQIPKINGPTAGPYENNHRDHSGEHRYNKDETRENTNNNERINNSDGSKPEILINKNDVFPKTNQHTKISANHLVDGPGETKNNNEKIDSNDRSTIDSVSKRDDRLVNNVPENNPDEKISANDQADRKQDNTQGQEDSSQSQNTGTDENNDHGDEKSIKVE